MPHPARGCFFKIITKRLTAFGFVFHLTFFFCCVRNNNIILYEFILQKKKSDVDLSMHGNTDFFFSF